jgi:predicted HTH transcriptional regulator
MTNYITFLKLKQSLEAKKKNNSLDPTAEKLVEQVAIHYAQEKSLTVTEAMKLEKIASPATIHRKLSELVREGWVEFAFEGTNRRTKYIIPTAKLDKYFENLSKLIAKS